MFQEGNIISTAILPVILQVKCIYWGVRYVESSIKVPLLHHLELDLTIISQLVGSFLVG